MIKYYYLISWASFWCAHLVSFTNFLGPLYPYWLYSKFMQDSFKLSEKYKLGIWVNSKPIQEKKIKFLLSQGGKIREVKVWVMKRDGTVCTVDKFGRVNWL